jgi:hypothetical protein|tara:strand:- start:763 stop:966 length:204 start_codon:yes stop_codon:yes gene_type:complete
MHQRKIEFMVTSDGHMLVLFKDKGGDIVDVWKNLILSDEEWMKVVRAWMSDGQQYWMSGSQLVRMHR